MRRVNFKISGILIALALLLSAAAKFAYCQSLTVEQYSAALTRVQNDADSASNGTRSAGLAAINDIAPVVRCTVRSGSYELFFVDNRALLSQMNAAQAIKDQDDYTNRWDEIGDQVYTILQAISKDYKPVDSADAQRSAEAVLSGVDFSSQPLPPKSGWEKFGEWFENLLKKLHLRPISGGPTGTISPIVPEVILIVIIVLAVGAAIYFIAQLIISRQGSIGRLSSDSGIALTLEEKELVATHNYNRLRELAQAAAETGDYRSALRLMFLAVLVMLDFEGAIRLDRSKTNWEYIRALSNERELQKLLQPFAAEFDRIWYGQRPASQGQYENALTRYDDVRALLERRAADAAAAASQNSSRRPASAHK